MEKGEAEAAVNPLARIAALSPDERSALAEGGAGAMGEGEEKSVIRRRAVLGVALLLCACVGPTAHAPGPYTRLDKDTEYRIDERPGGFRVSVNRSRYQFFPDFSEMRHACVSTVTSVAHDIAAQRGRRLRAIREDHIRVDTSRNLSGISHCAASATVEYE